MKNVGNEYGTALYMLAAEEGKTKAYATALDTVARAFDEEPTYFEFLQSPAVSAKERIQSIAAVFEAVLPTDVLSFLMLLCEKGRMACFYDAKKAYQALLDDAERVLNARVTSAVALTAEEKEKLENKLKTASERSVSVEYLIDPAILGGLIIETDGKIMDGSLRHRLFEIKGVINNE